MLRDHESQPMLKLGRWASRGCGPFRLRHGRKNKSVAGRDWGTLRTHSRIGGLADNCLYSCWVHSKESCRRVQALDRAWPQSCWIGGVRRSQPRVCSPRTFTTDLHRRPLPRTKRYRHSRELPSSDFRLLRLWNVSQVGLFSTPAVRELLFGIFVRDRRHDDDFLAMPPVDRRCHAMHRREL